MNGLESSRRCLVVRSSGRRSSRSLRQDELSSPGVTQSIDLAVVLDLHHCAGSEQVDARNSPHSCMERDARCRGRGRWRAVKEFRVRSGIARPAHVHVQAAETVTAMSKPRVLSIRTGSGNRYVIVASTRFGKPERAGTCSIQSVMRIILITSDAVVNPVLRMMSACVLPPVLRQSSRSNRLGVPRLRHSALVACAGIASSVTAS